MPNVFGEGFPGWEELDDRPLRPGQFVYLPPPDFTGMPEPVRFGDRPPATPVRPLSSPPPAPPPAPAPSLLDRLLGRRRIAPSQRAEREREEDLRSEHWVALLATGLREIGARRAYCRYDGGNDEGFAWLDHVEMKTGERLSPEEIGRRLAESNLLERLVAANLMWSDSLQAPEEAVRSIVRDTLAVEYAVMLLGKGFGTGPYFMYGAFTVDLDACTILDDRNAEPIVENIRLKT